MGHRFFVVLTTSSRVNGGGVEWTVVEDLLRRLHAHPLHVVLRHVRVGAVASCRASACFTDLRTNTATIQHMDFFSSLSVGVLVLVCVCVTN